jgi:ATP-dependent Clp protease ATP-binding subunit ClpA
MLSCLKPGYGLEPATHRTEIATTSSLERIGLAAVKKRFAPEFVNRIDSVITYQPLSREALEGILDVQLKEIERHLQRRLGMRSFSIEASRASRTFLLDRGISQEFGARELKRTLHRHIIHPLAAMVAADSVPAHSTVRIDVGRDRQNLRFRVRESDNERLRPAS